MVTYSLAIIMLYGLNLNKRINSLHSFWGARSATPDLVILVQKSLTDLEIYLTEFQFTKCI